MCTGIAAYPAYLFEAALGGQLCTLSIGKDGGGGSSYHLPFPIFTQLITWLLVVGGGGGDDDCVALT